VSMPFTREMGIGGSDVAAILGLSPYRTPFDVWLEKTSDPAFVGWAESPAMRFGSLMEPVLAKVYEEDNPGAKIILKGGAHSEPIWHPNGICYAHIDGVIAGEPAAISGPQNGIWEGKTAWDDRGWRGRGGELVPPRHYEAQVRSYLAITGEPWCDVTVFFRQTATFEHCRVWANPEIDEGLMDISADFWRDHIQTNIPPPIDGGAGASAFLLYRFPGQTREEALVATPEVDAWGSALAGVKAQMAADEKRKADIENTIKEAMGEYGTIRGTDWTAMWRKAKGRTTVSWQEIAYGYRGLLHQIGQALERGDLEEAVRLLTDNPPDGIVGLFTRQAEGTRPFIFRATEKG